jgi:transposase
VGIPYSLDLRQRVIEEVDKGMSQVAAAKMFKVSSNTIAAWLKRRSATNNLTPKTGYQKGHSHKITDWDEFEKFAETNKFLTGDEMLEKWMVLKNIEMGVDVIYEGLLKVGYTFKKKRFATQKVK